MYKNLVTVGLIFISSLTYGQEKGFTLNDNGSESYYGSILKDRPYAGDYQTSMIRSMWNSCWTANQQSSTPPQILSVFCDCIVDMIRNGQSHGEHQFSGGQFLQNRVETLYAPECSRQSIQRALTPKSRPL